MNKKIKSPLSTFEDDMKQIQDLLDKFDTGEISLEESTEKYHSLMELSKRCKKALEEAHLKITTIKDGLKK